jgi:hypothetical protein
LLFFDGAKVLSQTFYYKTNHPHIFWILGLQEHMTQGFLSFACQCQAVTRNIYTIFFLITAQLAHLLLCELDFKNMICKALVFNNHAVTLA